MKWLDLLQTAAREPVFSSALLLAGRGSKADVRRQLSRWVADGRLVRLRREVYTLAEPYRKMVPHPFLIANSMKRASYVSLQAALAHYGLIPEYVPTVTSVTTGRPETLDTAEGRYTYKHIKKPLFKGYTRQAVSDNQHAFVAVPEKAILDILYLTPGSDSRDFLRELRLQNLDLFDPGILLGLAEESGSGKLQRAAKRVIRLREEEAEKDIHR